MDSLTLVAVAAELRSQGTGGLGPVVLPRREELVVGWGRQALLINISAAAARLHLVADRPPSPRPEPSLQTHFDTLLCGAAVQRVAAVDFDRVLHLDLTNVDRVGTPRQLRLVVELMGKHSACLALDPDGLILATLKPVTRAVNRHRELLPRLPYVPPPGGRRDPRTLSAAEFSTAWPQLAVARDLRSGWRAIWYGLSDELWQWLCLQADLPPEATGAVGAAGADRLWQAWAALVERVAREDFEPCLRRGREGQPVGVWPLPLPGSEPLTSISAGLAEVASWATAGQRLASLRGEAVGRAKRALARAESLLQGCRRRAQRAAEAADWQHQADLLLANLHSLSAGAATLTVADYGQPGSPPRTLTLDPQLSGPQNATQLYERARKARAGEQGLAAATDAAEREVARCQALHERCRAAADPAEVERLLAGLPADPTAGPPPRTVRDKLLAKLQRHTSADGYLILVGRNATESEGLLSKLAAPSDLWLHVRGAGSGHVIIRTAGHPEQVPQSTLEEAARLAARQSKMKHSELVPVVYTERKHVTKIRGGAAGKVTYRQEQTIFVTP
ncbi:MAG: DUF814 domain-containing protein [Fimbriimonadaceae bacterium]|nr:DUF814 domain-containing protein [Fimbriimonadaceae bacterium]